MPYRILADAVLVVHLLFVLYVIFGGLLAMKWPRSAWLHLPAALWGAAIELAGRTCPLTPLEQHLRQLAEQRGYEGGFVEHYAMSVLYPGGLGRTQQIVLGIGVVAINAVVYGWIWRRSSRSRS